MKILLLLAVIAVAGCHSEPSCRNCKDADIAVARGQNPAMAIYADTHDCHPSQEWTPKRIVEQDGAEVSTDGHLFYDCPNDAILIMLFKSEARHE